MALTPLELLAPARDALTAIEAVRHGADAVYIGAPTHGARSAATNSVDDIAKVVGFAHRFRARVYVTINTIIYESELADVHRLVWRLYQIGVDALIVQDMAMLNPAMGLPPIPLHASTQCDIRTPQKAALLVDAGCSQLVLPRELTLDEISAIHATVPHTPLEVFVHGALCVSFSGDCQASLVATGRSANRGECAQICRLPYDLYDGDRRRILEGKHLLSLRDMCRIDQLQALIDAGATSFKIEGRLKDVAYVKQTVAAYRAAIDNVIALHPDRYVRSSAGESSLTFNPDLATVFNRGYIDYFITRRQPGQGTMATFDTPKSIGTPVATVVSTNKSRQVPTDRLTVKIDAAIGAPLANGDGLGYFDPEGSFVGFRLNRIEGNVLSLRGDNLPRTLPVGTRLYRNRSITVDRQLSAKTAERTIGVSATLRYNNLSHALCLDLVDERGCSCSVADFVECDVARRQQDERHRDIVAKTGGTVYRLDKFDDTAADIFIPASTLTALRRNAYEALDRAANATYTYDYFKARNTDEPDKLAKSGEPVKSEDTLSAPEVLTYHDNVANRLAREFYTGRGSIDIAPALECDNTATAEPRRVMTTRYCLLRELGACRRKRPNVYKLPLTLRGKGVEFNLRFDCANCQMEVWTV